MSASLVGSEMCIRDSLSSASYAMPHSTHLLHATTAGTEHAPRHANQHTARITVAPSAHNYPS
eukprot:2162527-Alexandrium_andersonii.AAC.1